MTISPSTRDQRLAIRVTTWQKAVIERAAAVRGGTVTDFAVRALLDRAEDVLADRPLFEVDQASWDEFNRLLDEPPAPDPRLVDLLSRPTVLDR
ncbi:MAG: DUF1778 domain-containing protein [Propionibacteriaceae bacterium]|jgi:uncharacterized protein (DUF1778 family)|nr:DUF1778 domain-containing protein [Propionibacteriaceae bacterium]